MGADYRPAGGCRTRRCAPRRPLTAPPGAPRRQALDIGRHRAGRGASLVPACDLGNRPPPVPHRRPTTFPRIVGRCGESPARATLCGDRRALILRERAPGSAGWADLTAAADASSHRIRTKFKDRAFGQGDGGRVRNGPSGRQSSVRTCALTRAALAAGTGLTVFFTPVTARPSVACGNSGTVQEFDASRMETWPLSSKQSQMLS